MSIPGFTAEASLHRMDGYHQIARISLASRAEVVPALSGSGCCEDCYAQVDAACSGIGDPTDRSECYEYWERVCSNCMPCLITE